jgi:bifunctional NMN adenylyltransferase/nudix hydrolase
VIIKDDRTKTVWGVIIARFQTPYLHSGHREVIDFVYRNHPNVMVILGVSPVLGSRHDPLDFETRRLMLLADYPRLTVTYVVDRGDDEVWSRDVDRIVHSLIPIATATLYGGRDSFIPHYHGKYPTAELENAGPYVSATELRKEAASKYESEPAFRSGVIWGAYNRFPSCFSVVDVAIFNSEGRLLLAQKSGEKKWRFIGGFADPHDASLEETARREAREETGLEIGAMEYVGSAIINDWRYKKEGDKIMTTFFRAQLIFGNAEAKDDISDVHWFELSRLTLADIVPAHHDLFRMLTKRPAEMINHFPVD